MFRNGTTLDFSNNSTIENKYHFFSQLTSNLSIVIIVIGVIFNTLTFLIFRLDKELKKMPSMVILSFVCISDTSSLFIWNLNGFLANFNLRIEYFNISTCKFFTFMQYSSLEISGLLLSLCSVDRYFTIVTKPGSFISKLPFGSYKSSFIWSVSIILFVCSLNSYLLLADRLLKSNYNFECYVLVSGFRIYDTWDKIHLFLYSFIPFTIMAIFNFLLIRKTRLSKKITPIGITQKSKDRKNLTYTLFKISIAFILMTLPSTIAFGFLNDSNFDYIMNKVILFKLLDNLSFFHHTTLFFTCFLSNFTFRNSVLNIIQVIKCKFLKHFKIC